MRLGIKKQPSELADAVLINNYNPNYMAFANLIPAEDLVGIIKKQVEGDKSYGPYGGSYSKFLERYRDVFKAMAKHDPKGAMKISKKGGLMGKLFGSLSDSCDLEIAKLMRSAVKSKP